ncbi:MULTISPECIES: restriction endonuclease [Actinosynnema]|uniref:restriction endonuclease n=1 Tax=Actinosynnema TaxID=40566 RepID=UPI0020A5493D|nr:restriction endonuclease [Actinosynnema pretiosum]MCP2096558.1 restriction system protein [Actinosynnema pretiosum]
MAGKRKRARGGKGKKRSRTARNWLLAAVAVVVLVVVRFVQENPVLSAWIGALLLALLITAGVVALKVRRARKREQAERDRLIEFTDGMGGVEFEQWTARLLERSGFLDVTVVGGAGDAGADVLAQAPDGGRLVVQCKRYGPNNKVGSEALQRFAGTARAYHGADYAVLVTTSSFTAPARDVANRVGIVLVDRVALAEWARTAIAPAELTAVPSEEPLAG